MIKMTYKIKINRLSISNFCDVLNEDNELVYSVKSQGLFNSEYAVLKNDYKIASIDCKVITDRIGDQETVSILTTASKNDIQVAEITSTTKIFTKRKYRISGFDYTINSNALGTYYKVTNDDDEIIAHVDSNILSSDYVLNVLNYEEEDILIALLMTLIEQRNDPNNTTQSIISGLVGNTFKKD